MNCAQITCSEITANHIYYLTYGRADREILNPNSMKVLIVLSIVLTQGAFLFGQQGSDGALELIRQGVVLHDQHDYEGAIEKYDEALVLDPFNLTALSEKAMTLYYQEKYEEAVENCKLAIEKHPGDDLLKMVYPTYANALDTDGKPEDAIDVYNEGIKLFPDYGQLHYNKGVTHVGQEEYDDALASFETSARLDPNHGSSHNGVGRLQSLNKKKMPTLLALLRFAVVEPEGPRPEANFPIIEKIIFGSATRTGKNTITISLDDISVPDEEEGEEAEIQANDFASTEILLSFAALLAVESKKPVEGFKNQMESICSSLKENQEENFGYYWEYYVPYFLEMQEENLLETFSYIIYLSSGSKKIQKWIKKNPAKINEFYEWSSQYEWSTE